MSVYMFVHLLVMCVCWEGSSVTSYTAERGELDGGRELLTKKKSASSGLKDTRWRMRKHNWPTKKGERERSRERERDRERETEIERQRERVRESERQRQTERERQRGSKSRYITGKRRKKTNMCYVYATIICQNKLSVSTDTL